MKKKYTVYLHPFILALYPALFLYSYNIIHYRESVLLTALLASLAIAFASYAIFLLIFRKLSVAAIVTSAFLFFFFSYGRFRQPLGNMRFDLGPLYINSDRLLFFAFFAFMTLVIYFSWRNRKKLLPTNRTLFTLSSILLAYTILNVGYSEIKLGRISLAKETSQQTSIHGTSSANTPDIYYIILDRHAGIATLKDYNYDESRFRDFLKSKGFYIADESTSNYPKTFESLASTLNLEYLDHLTQETNGGATSDESIATPMIQNNQVIKFLKGQGYKYIHVGSSWDPNRTNPNADVNLIMAGGAYPFPTDEFSAGFINLTAASVVLNKIYPDTTAVSEDPLANEHRSRILYQFSTFTDIPKMSGPKYVFAHILIPHPPFVLDKNCQPINEAEAAKHSELDDYTSQLHCGDILAEQAINEILEDSPSKPIIIVQGDEGPMPKQHPIPSNLDWAKASNASIKEKFPIINAYLWPEHEDKLYQSITPVNTFRLLFDTYFSADLPLLADKNYIFQDANHLYDFTDVTTKVSRLLWGK